MSETTDLKLATYMITEGYEFVKKVRKQIPNTDKFQTTYMFNVSENDISSIKQKFVNNQTISNCLSAYESLRRLEAED
jgi:hypothetical protein